MRLCHSEVRRSLRVEARYEAPVVPVLESLLANAGQRAQRGEWRQARKLSVAVAGLEASLKAVAVRVCAAHGSRGEQEAQRPNKHMARPSMEPPGLESRTLWWGN